jgi:hypothetical protein
MIKLLFLPEVLRDAADAANWYDERKPALGDHSLSRLRATYDPISAHPFA